MEFTQVSTLTHALKEWAVTVDALGRGETILLLRKGGIREEGGRFSISHSPIWLYPTYEHQQPRLLKSDYAAQVEPVASGWHPPSVSIAAFADITDIFEVSDAATVTALLPFHIWNEQFVIDRFQWKPRQPLYLLLLRVQQLSEVQTVPYCSEYGGCKSWIEVEPLSIAQSTAVLSDAAYQQKVSEIRQIVRAE